MIICHSSAGGDSSSLSLDKKQLRFTAPSRNTVTTLRVDGVGGKTDRGKNIGFFFIP
jgi:hypothetical protein